MHLGQHAQHLGMKMLVGGKIGGFDAQQVLPSTSLWAVMGVSLRGWLSSPARLRAFNWTMAALLVGSLALLI